MNSHGLPLSLIPMPFGDETFGSWFGRCADSYRTTRTELMMAILKLNEGPRVPADFDWDTDPPAHLLKTIAKLTPVSVSEMEYLIVHKGPATLPPKYRDTYCPECFKQDRSIDAIYYRRAWLDAWTIHCPVHQCLLGRFSAYLYTDYLGRETGFPAGVYAAHPLDIPTREQPTVRDIGLRKLVPRGSSRRRFDCSSPDYWFDPDMLRSVVGRDLLIIAGSEQAMYLTFELFGEFRSTRFVWHDSNNEPLWWPDIRHPIGSIDTRVPAAQLAGMMWNCFRESKASARYFRRVVTAVKGSLSLRQGKRHPYDVTKRWSRVERDRWTAVFMK
jgi:hypothetical protein